MPKALRKPCKAIADHTGMLVLASAVLAFLFPGVFGRVEPVCINPLLGLVMFGMGLALRMEDCRIVASRPKDVLAGCAAQWTIMPFLAWALAKAFALDDALALGVVLVGCCPGGTASNVITYIAKGDLSLSVAMTAVSTLIAPVATPFLVWLLAGRSVDVDVAGMLSSILWVVILPIVAGLAAKRAFPAATARAVDAMPAVSSLAICFIVAVVVAANASKLLSGGIAVMAVVALHNLSGLALGYAAAMLAGMDSAKRRAVAIEVGMQNSGLASSLATLHFAAYPMAAVPGAVFSVWHNLSGAAAARVFAKSNTMDDGRQPG